MKRAGVAPRFRWRLIEESPAQRDRLAEAHGLHPILAQVLVNRKIEAEAALREFFEPSLHCLPDPSELPDMEAAIDVLVAAREQKTPVLIHGDYDVDGLSGTALLHRLLRKLDIPVSVFLPDRIRDGYSFGDNSLAAIRERKARVVVAVDNGTTAIGPLQQLHEEGVEVVVVDHHLPGASRPRCSALLNPWVGADSKAFRHFCGTGVAYLLAWGLLRRVRGEARLPEADRRFLIDALGLAALATVADVMPLHGPNRALVARGLQTLGGSGLPGLQALVRSSRIQGPAQAQDFGFRIAPRLNAAGRLGKSELAFRLLSTDDPLEADSLAQELESLNLERRETEQRELAALEPLAQASLERGDKVLFLGRQEAHFGVLGIVANRLLDSTGLPTLLWAECEPGVARGSARAPEGFDLVDLLDSGRELLSGYGGHARAAGFQFDPENAEALGESLRSVADGWKEPEPPTLDIDLEVNPAELDARAVTQLERCAPFGEGNPEPVFLASDLEVVAPVKMLGNSGEHAALMLRGSGRSVRALGWRMAPMMVELEPGDRVDAAFTAGFNHFQGRRSLEWTLRDLRSASIR